MAKVVLDHISKSFDKTDVIRDVSLDVDDKEFIVLVGPSGCGKSTVLRMIAGLETPNAGEIKIDDRLMNDVAPKDRDIAMVFQNYALYPHMSVYDNMAFGLKMRGVPKDEIDKKVKEVAGILDLGDLLERKPKQLSGGQRQRVALGRAIVRDPKVFLMDEPLSNLDAKLRVHMRSEIAKLHKRLNATTVYVTHDQAEAMTMGDRIVILNKGAIQQIDTPMNVYNTPANLFVAGFIGQMNMVTGILEGGNLKLGDETIITLPSRMTDAAKDMEGRAAVLGIRPEHFSIAKASKPKKDDSSDGDNAESKPKKSSKKSFTVDVTPERTELMGNEKLVHFTLSGEMMIAALAPDASVGSKLTLTVDMDKVSLFDGASEKRIG